MKTVFGLAICILFLFPNLLLGYKANDSNEKVTSSQISNKKAGKRTRRISSTDQRHNFCEVYNQVMLGKISRREALNGMNVSIGVVDYSMDQETGKLDENYIANMVFDEVARRAKFSYKDFVGVVPTPTGDETFTGVLTYIVDNYDIAVDWWIRSLERTALGASGSEPWYDSSTIIITKESPTKTFFNFQAAFSPFSKNVWIATIITIAISGFAYHINAFLMLRGNRERRDRLGDNLFKTVLAFMGHTTFDPKYLPNRILLVSISFLFLVLLAAYTANLASFLVLANKNQKPIMSLQDVIDYDRRVCVWKPSGDIVEIRFEYPNARYVDKPNELEVYQGLANDECEVALISVESHRKYTNMVEYNPNCDLKVVGLPVRKAGASFAQKTTADLCSSIVRDVVDLFIFEIRKDGTLDKIKEKAYESLQKCNAAEKVDDDSQNLSLWDLSGVFIIHYAILISVFILSVLHVAFPRYFKSTIHEIAIVRKASDIVNVKVRGILKSDKEEEHESNDEEQGNYDNNLHPIEPVDNMFPGFVRGASIDTANYALCAELHKVKNDMKMMKSAKEASEGTGNEDLHEEVLKMKAEMRAEMRAIQSEIIKEMRSIHSEVESPV